MRPHGKGKYRSMDNKKIGIERGKSYWENKEISGWQARIHRSLTDMFWQSHMSFSITRETLFSSDWERHLWLS